MNKQLLIFDLDGTLIDSVPDLTYAINAMLDDLAKPNVDIEQVRGWVGNGAKKLIERALQYSYNNTSIKLTDNEITQAMVLFLEHYNQHTCVDTQPYSFVPEGLLQLRKSGFILALVTNKPKQFLPTIFEKFGWQDVFSAVLGGDSLTVKKPNPAPLLWVCQQLNISLDRAYMIGDSKNDILAGQNAGMDTLALSYGYNYGQDIRVFNPTKTFDDFATLVTWLKHSNY